MRTTTVFSATLSVVLLWTSNLRPTEAQSTACGGFSKKDCPNSCSWLNGQCVEAQEIVVDLCAGNKNKNCPTPTCAWIGGSCQPAGPPPSPTPPPPSPGPVCGYCADGGNFCSSDADCGTVCDAKCNNNGISCEGQICSTNEDCPPSGGKPAFRSSCVEQAGSCEIETCPTTYACPNPGDSLMIDPGYIGLSHSSTLCTLQKITIDATTTSVKPIARSYHNNDWEVAAGSFAASLLTNEDIACSGDCYFDLPPVMEGESYVLTSYSEGSLLAQEKRARLLEMGTFGTSPDELNAFTGTDEDWVQSQMSLDHTSHRAYWRQRSNPRWTFSQRVGRSDHPCSPNSKWRRFTFTRKDRHRNDAFPGGYLKVQPMGPTVLMNVTEYDLTVVEKLVRTGPYVLWVDGHPRTVVQDFRWRSSSYNNLHPYWDPDHEYKICNYMAEKTTSPLGESYFRLQTKPITTDTDGSCQDIDRSIGMGNPPVDFTNFEDLLGVNVFNLDSTHIMLPYEDHMYNDDVVDRRILSAGLSAQDFPLCDNIAEQAEDSAAPVWVIHQDHGLLQWDPRLILESNTLDDSSGDGGGSIQQATSDETSCSNAPRTFLNKDQCFMSTEPTACSGSITPPDTLIELNSTNILALHSLTDRYSYSMLGLKVKQPEFTYEIEHPCTPGLRSRWVKALETTCQFATDLQIETKNTLTSLFAQADTNPYIHDIYMGNTNTCNGADTNPEIEIQVGTTCYTRVHPEHLSVWDLTYWVDHHPGNNQAATNGNPHPITKWMAGGSHTLTFPSDHPMDASNDHTMSRWDNNNDKFQYVGRYGDSVAFRDLPSALRLSQVAEYFGVSASENGFGVIICGSPDEVTNDKTLESDFDLTSYTSRDTSYTSTLGRQREVVWTMVALYGPDQLRQRMAWALSQILVVAKDAIAVQDRSTEMFLVYYDIFVRNAFGNYLDILREVSYNPLMSENLSFLDSKSTAYVWERYARKEWADENYAREIMQLFSTGLFALNLDGTPKLDAYNNTIQVYTNEDIRSFARAWTGFTRQSTRGNVEYYDNRNRVDPMRIEAEWRDLFPKSDLYGGYIGDRYALCVDLPSKQFLRKGAKYRLLGGSALPTMMVDDARFTDRFNISTTSSLYSQLCGDQGAGCTFPVEVELTSNLNCDAVECDVDEVRVVEVTPGVFYEYIRPPCVEHPFFVDAIKINREWKSRDAMCANANLPAASSACCDTDTSYDAMSNNFYHIERMTLATQQQRCSAIGQMSCEYGVVDRNAPSWENDVVFSWAASPCSIQAKINPEGEVTVVHKFSTGYPDRVVKHVREDNFNYFGVGWENGEDNFPKVATDACGTCAVVETNNCLCDTSVVESALFSSAPASANDILSLAHVGAPDPTSFSGNYAATYSGENYIVHESNGNVGVYDQETIFEVSDGIRTFFLKNVKSTVHLKGLQGEDSAHSFRSPVTFMSFIPSQRTARDAMYETEATLEHYFYHDNTAPFLCVRFIQRFGISNASPRYVKTCAEAFRSGTYQAGSQIFGTGKYGDLAATVAAIVLDREARDDVLDADPSQGSIREPLVKVISLMRNLKFEPIAGEQPMVILDDINEVIGQMAHEQETVFSYFLPEFQPPGPVTESSLVSPEAQILDMPKTIAILNGMHAMISYGLAQCPASGYGFGFNVNSGGCNDGQSNRATGDLTFVPSSTNSSLVVDELATILTSGRLNDHSRNIISTAYDSIADYDAALRVATKLMVTTPEFHTNNPVKFSGEARPPPEPPQSSGSSYKAIVFLMFSGGADTYQMLVPKTCTAPEGGVDAYTHYVNTREPVHMLQNELLPIGGSGQVGCSEFGIHENLPIVQQLYNDNDLLFVANTGALGMPSNKTNYRYNNPIQIFAHNAMQLETKRVDIFKEAAGTGVLGRLTDVLTRSGSATASISVNTQSITLQGTAGVSPTVNIISESGITQFRPNDASSFSKEQMVATAKSLNDATSVQSSFMAETFSASLVESLDNNEKLYTTLNSVDVVNDFGSRSLGRRLKIVAKMMQTRLERGADTDVYYLEIGGWDTHSNVKSNLVNRFTEVDEGLSAFVSEMKNKTLWDKVTIVQASEFARTLTPNTGSGTDHGWGGNYFITGGLVKGGQILGEFPVDMSDESPIGLGRGRLVPTTSWDQVWNGIAEHHGIVNAADLDFICPNRGEFSGKLFSASDLYKTTGRRKRKYLRR